MMLGYVPGSRSGVELLEASSLRVESVRDFLDVKDYDHHEQPQLAQVRLGVACVQPATTNTQTPADSLEQASTSNLKCRD